MSPDTYRYRSNTSYEALLQVDQHGLVISYADQWSRIP